MGRLLLTCATTALSRIAMWHLSGATPRGQPWTPAVTLPQGRDGLSARRMAVWWTLREPSLGRHMPHELMRNAVLNLTLTRPATARHQRNYEWVGTGRIALRHVSLSPPLEPYVRLCTAYGSREEGTFPCTFPFHQLHLTCFNGQLTHSLDTFVLRAQPPPLGPSPCT